MTLENSLNTLLISLSNEALFAYCHPKVLAYLEYRAWRLVRDIEIFVGEVTAEVRRRAVEVQRPLDLLVEDATIFCYGRRWVAMCRADGTLRQREALLAVGYFFNRVIRPFLAVITPQIFWDEPFISDAVQQSVIAVWRSLHTLKDEGAFVYWCQRILRRTVRRMVMADERYRSLPRQADIGPEPMDPVEASFTLPILTQLSMTAAELTAVLEPCLRSSIRRYVIVALYLEQKTLGQIAAELNLPVRTVSQYKAKALRQLRDCEGLIAYLRGLLV